MLALLEGGARFAQYALGFNRSQTFIQKYNGQFQKASKPLGKLPGVFTLPALGTTHMEGFADQQRPDIPLEGNVFQVLEIVSNTRALKCVDALRSNSKFITHGKPNSLLANIEREYTATRLARSRKLILSIQIVQLRIIEGIAC
jgi:hypothetical protein